MKNIYEKEVMAHKDEPIIQKHLKQIKLNKTLWLVGACLGLVLTIVMIVLTVTVGKDWATNIKAIAIAIPAVVTALLITMTILIWLGNQVGIKYYKDEKITFYSGPWTNVLYVDDKLIYKGSSETKMVATLKDKSICKIVLKATSFSINILPPGSDPVTGLPKRKEEPKPIENKK